MYQDPTFNDKERNALERLIAHAKRDSGQAFKIADFLLCWWNAPSLGKFDFTEIWSLDDTIVQDVCIVFAGFSTRKGLYADNMGYTDDFKEIISLQR